MLGVLNTFNVDGHFLKFNFYVKISAVLSAERIILFMLFTFLIVKTNSLQERASAS